MHRAKAESGLNAIKCLGLSPTLHFLLFSQLNLLLLLYPPLAIPFPDKQWWFVRQQHIIASRVKSGGQQLTQTAQHRRMVEEKRSILKP